jgi:hypothetical protein
MLPALFSGARSRPVLSAPIPWDGSDDHICPAGSSLTTESETRGDININEFLDAFAKTERTQVRDVLSYWPLLKRELLTSLGLSADGKPISDQGLIGANANRYRTAFNALRLLNIEYLSRCCAQISEMEMTSEQELSENRKVIEQAAATITFVPPARV